MQLKRIFLLVTVLFLSQANALRAANLQSLADHQTWLNLLRYEQDSSSESGYLSAIHSPTFFLSKQGRWDAHQELQATLAALKAPIDDEPNKHARCRFPARTIWLSQQLPNQVITSVKPSDCPDFYDWSEQGTTESLSIVFASGFLGNPASFYGHTLLKLNGPKTKTSTQLEDTSVNYGAIDIDQDNPVAYILKGIFGGYESGFSDIKYYFHDHNYGENELRDMWEYPLNLSKDEVTFLVAHAWEVMGQKYTYYFFKQNCAYRMAELFNIIDGIDIVPSNPLWVFPQAVIQKAQNSTHNGKKLLSGFKRHLSRQSDLYHKYSTLDDKQQAWVEDIANDISLLNQQSFNQLPTQSKKQIVDTLLDYYNVVRDKQALDADPANRAYKKVLAKRFALPPGAEATPKANINNPPHKGRKPSYVSAGIVDSDNGQAMRVRIRPAYYDPLDSDDGHIDFAQLSMGDLSLDFDDANVSLNYLDIIRIRSINSKATGLPGDSGFAWNIRTGWQKLNLSCSDCTTFRVQGDMGYSFPIDQDLVVAAYVGGGIQDRKQQQSHAFTRASLEAIGRINDKWRYSAAIEARHFIEAGTEYHQNFQLRYRINTNMDVRASYQHDGSSSIGLSFGLYW